MYIIIVILFCDGGEIRKVNGQRTKRFSRIFRIVDDNNNNSNNNLSVFRASVAQDLLLRCRSVAATVDPSRTQNFIVMPSDLPYGIRKKASTVSHDAR